jgi:hypothetical protein
MTLTTQFHRERKSQKGEEEEERKEKPDIWSLILKD